MANEEKKDTGGRRLDDPKWRDHNLFMPKEAAVILDRSPWTIWDAMKRGQIPTITVGRRRYIPRGVLVRIISGETAA